jgi:phosphate starvation-inducible PhoH-like protein
MKIYGKFDENIKEIEKKFNVRVLTRENSLKLIGEDKNIEKAIKVLNKLNDMVNDNIAIDQQSLSYLIDIIEKGDKDDLQRPWDKRNTLMP